MMDKQEVEAIVVGARRLRIICPRCYVPRALFTWAYEGTQLTCPYCASQSEVEENEDAEVLIRILRLPTPITSLFTSRGSIVTRRISERIGWW